MTDDDGLEPLKLLMNETVIRNKIEKTIMVVLETDEGSYAAVVSISHVNVTVVDDDDDEFDVLFLSIYQD